MNLIRIKWGLNEYCDRCGYVVDDVLVEVNGELIDVPSVECDCDSYHFNKENVYDAIIKKLGYEIEKGQLH